MLHFVDLNYPRKLSSSVGNSFKVNSECDSQLMPTFFAIDKTDFQNDPGNIFSRFLHNSFGSG